MKLKDLFKPAWQHSNPKVRLKTVKTKNLDEIVLSKIIKNGKEEKEIILSAVEKLNNLHLTEKLFMEVYGENAEEIRKCLLKKIKDEQKIRSLYLDIRKKGGLSFLEVVLELRLFEIWDEQIDNTTDTKSLMNIIEKSRNYILGSYVSAMAFSVTQKAIQKVKDLVSLASWVEREFSARKELHYSIRNGLLERLKQDDAIEFFGKISNQDLLLVFFKGGNSSLGKGAIKRFAELGKRIRVEESDKIVQCSSCGGNGGGETRVPYTDRDWAWEKCESCNGTGKETKHIKEYFIEDL